MRHRDRWLVYTVAMYGFIFKLFAFAIALLVALYAAANAFRNARKLDARIAEYKRDEEDKRRRGVASDPYGELAEIYSKGAKKTGKRRDL